MRDTFVCTSTATFLAVLACLPVHATTSNVSENGFVVTVKHEVSVAPSKLYQRILHIDQWWSSEHTWSGAAQNLSLDARAGGCFCERWQGNSVEHARVLTAMPNRLLRLSGALGPLQALGVNGVLDFALVEKQGSSTLTVTYRVFGSGVDLRELAPAVDGVITDQVSRLFRYAESS